MPPIMSWSIAVLEPYGSRRELFYCRRLPDTSRACTIAIETEPLDVDIGSGTISTHAHIQGT